MIQQIYISVTQDDIDKGERGNACKCPIALALRRAVPSISATEVSEAVLYFEDGTDRWFVGDVPFEVVQFIELFDAKAPVVPFDTILTFFRKESLHLSLLEDIAQT